MIELEFENILQLVLNTDPTKLNELNEARGHSVIESIKLVRSWCGDSISIQDIKIGLDAWFMNRDFNNQNAIVLKRLLDYYVTMIYANKELFLMEFFEPKTGYHIENICFVGNYVRVEYSYVGVYGGYCVSLSRNDVLKWVDELK